MFRFKFWLLKTLRVPVRFQFQYVQEIRFFSGMNRYKPYDVINLLNINYQK